MGKALQIRQKAADSPQGLTARRWPALLALARKAAGPYGEDVAALEDCCCSISLKNYC